MVHSRSIQFALLLALGILALGGISVLKGGFFIGKHEGDTLHLMEIVIRMAAGELPHEDIMTPLGILGFLPISLFVAAGMGVGQAILWGQVLAALVVAPMAWWIAASRLSRGVGLLFCLVIVVLMLALVHGESQPAVSISLHYNRWAWALTFIAVTGALFRPLRAGTGGLDGAVIGTAMATLVLIKVTYFVAFALPVAAALWLTGQKRALVVAGLAGLAVALVVTALLGPAFWLAYLADLREVSDSPVRPQPGLPIMGVLTAPLYLGASLTALAAVIFLRKAGEETGGLILLLLAPGFAYVTFQNFGNDPQWLLLLAVLLLSMMPQTDGPNAFGLGHRAAVGGTAAVALAFAAPSFFNLLYSPFRHYSVEAADYVPMLPGGGVHADLYANDIRAVRTDLRVPVDAPEIGLAAFREEEARDIPVEFLGERRADCYLDGGMLRAFEAMATDVAARYPGAGVFTADLFSPFWLFADLRPLHRAAPWYYGGLPGIEDADLILVPICPVSADVQAKILTALTERGTQDLQEVHRTGLYILYRIGDGAVRTEELAAARAEG